ncbi:lipoprotein, tandem type, partial [Leptospira interrogans]
LVPETPANIFFFLSFSTFTSFLEKKVSTFMLPGQREYIFNYEGKEGIVQLNLWGEFPVREGTMDMLTAKANMIIPSDPKSSGEIGRIDLAYGNESIAKARHGRFKTLEECEAQYAADDVLVQKPSFV